MKTMKGKPITVKGNVLKLRDLAPNFTAHTNQFTKMSLSDVKTPYVLISVVPSLDTSVCSFQTRMINEKLAAMKNLTVLTLSNDLPFAQKRWCGAEGLNITTLSDHMDLDFAHKYGVLIEEMRLLARAVFLLDSKRQIIYLEYLDEMSHHPNYDALVNFIENLPKA